MLCRVGTIVPSRRTAFSPRRDRSTIMIGTSEVEAREESTEVQGEIDVPFLCDIGCGHCAN